MTDDAIAGRPATAFRLALYVTAYCVETPEDLDEALAFFERYLSLDKLYLENFRNGRFRSIEHMRTLKAVAERHGLATAGGITTTDEAGRVFCYSRSETKTLLRSVVEAHARVFDEIILDDFFFTDCTCDDCRKARGARSWSDFRLALLTDVSRELVAWAKAVNPRVRVIIKYPNWIESYRYTGYNPVDQPAVFDGVYVGTETRDTRTTEQHLPRYASYALVRWFEALLPGRTYGAWFDPYECTHLDDYLDQAILTALAKPREITLFCLSSLRDTVYVPAVGYILGRLRETVKDLGEPQGLSVYVPPLRMTPESHLYDVLGMLGIPLAPVPRYPEAARKVLLTADAEAEDDILDRLEATLDRAGTVILTAGFVVAWQDRGLERVSPIRVEPGRLSTARYSIAQAPTRVFAESAHATAWPVLRCPTNTAGQPILAWSERFNTPVLCIHPFGRGRVIVLNVPDDPTALADLPSPVLAALRAALSEDGVVLDGPGDVALLAYEGGTLVVKSFRSEPTVWRLRTRDGGPERREEGPDAHRAFLQPLQWTVVKTAPTP